MIPILFDERAEDFSTHGICRLPDCMYCKSHQVLNGLFEIVLKYPYGGRNFEEIKDKRIIVAKPDLFTSDQPYRIYKIEETHKNLIVYARHKLYDLAKVPVAPFSAVGVVPALTGLVSNAMTPVNCTVWTDIQNTETLYSQTVPMYFRTLLGGVSGSILDQFGGEYEWDNSTIKLHAHRGSDQGVEIRYAKNLKSFENVRTSETAYNGCVAFWTEDDAVVYGTIQWAENRNDFPVDSVYRLDATEDFDEAPTVEQLNARSRSFMEANNIGSPFSDTVKVSHVNIADAIEYKNKASLERVGIGDTVHLLYRSYNVAMRVVEYTFDVLKERYISIILGKKKATFSDAVKDITKTAQDETVDKAVSMMQTAINHASDVLAGGTGGYIVIGRNAEGQPNEIYIMDSPDQGTAVNVLRINYAGLAFSQTGINGQYTTAWTIDSNFYADFITAGSLNGNLITAGSILTSALEAAIQTVIDGIKLNFSFLSDGLHIAQKDQSGLIVGTYQTIVSDLGLRVIETASNTSVLVAERDTVTAENLTANQYLRIKAELVSSRFQQFYSSAHQEYEFAAFWEV